MEELDLKELFTIFWYKKLQILLIILISVIAGIVYSYFFVVPKYKSSTKLVLVQSSSTVENNGNSAITQTDLTLNSKLVSTYSVIMESDSLVRQVVQELDIEGISEGNIKNNISVQSVKDTDVIEITVQNKNPNYAAQIANKIAEVFSEKIVEIYNISNIYILDRAEPDSVPSNVNHVKDITIFAFLGIVVSVIFVLVSNMLDTTIKTEEDIEKCSGLLVLSSIPNYGTELNKRRGGRGA